MTRVTLTRRGLLLAAALCAALPGFAAEADAVEVIDFDWDDAARGRAVPVRLYWPAAAGSAPRPLVVFSHGIGGSRLGYSYLGRHFAGQGIASLHLQHVGSDRSLWTGGGWSLLGRLRDAAQEGEAIARVEDLRFALDQLLAGELGARIDANRIVAAGHSYGANTTLLAAGARVQRDGRWLDLRDARIQAAILISAPPFYGEDDVRSILAGVTVPSLHITTTDDVIRIPGYYSGAADRVALFDATGSARKLLAVFDGGSHSVFTDRGNTGGAMRNPQIKSATQALSLAFLKSVFDGDDGPLRAWPQRYAPLVTRFVGAG